jgi:GNAT superfamily N-acetyltransferase
MTREERGEKVARSRPWKVRPMSTDDEQRIVDLFQTVFGQPMTRELWRWQFPGNPFSRPIVYLAESEDGTLAGHYALVPTPLVWDGKTTLAGLSIQSMIHPAFQKQGILKALAAAAEQQLDEDGVTVGITFLNDNSLHAYTTHFGWTEMEGPNPIHFTVLDAAGPATRVLRSSALGTVAGRVAKPIVDRVFARPRRPGPKELVEIATFDERADRLWSQLREGVPCAVDRSSKYLNWRLVEKPVPYRRFVLERNTGIDGLVVTRTERKFGIYFGYIVELLFDPARPDVGERLVAGALDDLRDHGCSMATALTSGSPSVQRALSLAGFWRLPRRAMPHGIHFCYKIRHGDQPASSRWFLSWSDHDVV